MAADPGALVFDAPFFRSVGRYLDGYLKPMEAAIPGLMVRSKIEDESFRTPYLLIGGTTGAWNSDGHGNGDNRFMRRSLVDIQTWTEGIYADDQAEALHELVYLRLWTCWKRQVVLPGIGHISHLGVSTPPHQTSDWATSQGSNQYANLPKGTLRYQAKYQMAFRPPRGGTQAALDDAIASLTGP